jgi:hypothetical protein
MKVSYIRWPVKPLSEDVLVERVQMPTNGRVRRSG